MTNYIIYQYPFHFHYSAENKSELTLIFFKKRKIFIAQFSAHYNHLYNTCEVLKTYSSTQQHPQVKQKMQNIVYKKKKNQNFQNPMFCTSIFSNNTNIST